MEKKQENGEQMNYRKIMKMILL